MCVCVHPCWSLGAGAEINDIRPRMQISVVLFICSSVCPPLRQPVCLPVRTCPYTLVLMCTKWACLQVYVVYLFVCLSVSLSIRLAVCPSVLVRNRLVSNLTNMDMQTTFCVCLSVRRPVTLFIRLCVCLFITPSVCPLVCPAACVCPFACSYGPVSVWVFWFGL